MNSFLFVNIDYLSHTIMNLFFSSILFSFDSKYLKTMRKIHSSGWINTFDVSLLKDIKIKQQPLTTLDENWERNTKQNKKNPVKYENQKTKKQSLLITSNKKAKTEE